MNENATVIERITEYVRTGQEAKAETLAHLCDYLEDCAMWDIHFTEES